MANDGSAWPQHTIQLPDDEAKVSVIGRGPNTMPIVIRRYRLVVNDEGLHDDGSEYEFMRKNGTRRTFQIRIGGQWQPTDLLTVQDHWYLAVEKAANGKEQITVRVQPLT